jgi:hypothetical protein
MPFEQFTPRQFTTGGVRSYAPSVSGVYGISNAREWIFVGAADNIQGALLDHLQNVHTPIMRREPLGFVFEVCDRARRVVRYDRLVQEYEPACNRHLSRYS